MPKLFVIMPFGRKRHEGIEYDFDSVYRNVIRPVAQQAGWTVLRIDEVSQPGAINDQYLKELLTAELVLADISVPNANVYYELGIRHSVSTAGTLLVSSSGPSDVPFDLQGQRILFFSRSEASLLKKGLRSALSEFRIESVTSPLRPIFERAGILADPKRQEGDFERDVEARVARAKNPEQLIALWKWLEPLSPLPTLPLRDLAERLSDCREWLSAADVLRAAARQHPGDFEIQRRLGWFLQQSIQRLTTQTQGFRFLTSRYGGRIAECPSDPSSLRKTVRQGS